MLEAILAGIVGAETTLLVVGYFGIRKYIQDIKAAPPAAVAPVIRPDTNKILAWLDAMPGKAEVAVRREAALLAASLKAQ